MIEPRGSVTATHGAGVSDARARKTALLVSAVSLVIAAWNLYRGRTSLVVIFGAVGASLLIIGFLIPPAARAFHSAWMRLAAALGYVNSRVLLTLMYYLALTPYGLVSRAAGRDPLNRRGEGKDSYWTRRKATRQTREQFERLF